MLILNLSAHQTTPNLCGYDCILETPQSMKMLLGTTISPCHAQLHVVTNETVQRPQIFDVPENTSLVLAKFQIAHIEERDPIKPERNGHIKVEAGNNLNERKPISRKELTSRRELKPWKEQISQSTLYREISASRKNNQREETDIAEELLLQKN